MLASTPTCSSVVVAVYGLTFIVVGLRGIGCEANAEGRPILLWVEKS